MPTIVQIVDKFCQDWIFVRDTLGDQITAENAMNAVEKLVMDIGAKLEIVSLEETLYDMDRS